MRRRWNISKTYGTPHPALSVAKAEADFVQSVYDAAPFQIRYAVMNDVDGSGLQDLFDWFYSCSNDPRRKEDRKPRGGDFRNEKHFPPFPWERPDNSMSIRELFGW